SSDVCSSDLEGNGGLAVRTWRNGSLGRTSPDSGHTTANSHPRLGSPFSAAKPGNGCAQSGLTRRAEPVRARHHGCCSPAGSDGVASAGRRFELALLHRGRAVMGARPGGTPEMAAVGGDAVRERTARTAPGPWL